VDDRKKSPRNSDGKEPKKRAYKLADKIEAFKMKQRGESWLAIAQKYCKPDPKGQWYNAIKMVKKWVESVGNLLETSALKGGDIERMSPEQLQKQKFHPGKAPVLPSHLEKELAEWYTKKITSGDSRHGATAMLMSKAQEVAIANGKDLKASSMWVKLFKKRWNLR